jgi:hypothetical protein
MVISSTNKNQKIPRNSHVPREKLWIYPYSQCGKKTGEQKRLNNSIKGPYRKKRKSIDPHCENGFPTWNEGKSNRERACFTQ